MTHNHFNLEFDFLRPLIAFFSHLNLKFSSDDQSNKPTEMKKKLMYPPATIINYERTIFKHSSAWGLR